MRITWNHYVRTREDLAGKVTRHLQMDSTTLLQLLDSDAYLAPMGFNRETSRCLFIPNTYEVYWNISPDGLFKRMQKEYEAFWNESRRRKADSIGLTPIEVAIVASIVESESNNKKELPILKNLYLYSISVSLISLFIISTLLCPPTRIIGTSTRFFIAKFSFRPNQTIF